MALDKTDIAQLARQRLYGAGLGEKPTITQGTGTITVTGDKVSFDVATGEGASLRAGHILTAYRPEVDAEYGFYILSVTDDTIVAVNGYDGVSAADAASVPTLLEVNAPITGMEFHEAVDAIIDGYLFPEVFDFVVDTFTPNLATFQSNANALDEKIIRGWQKIGVTINRIEIGLTKNVGTSEFASGKMISYSTATGIDVSYSVTRRVSLANSTRAGLAPLISKGAAALLSENVSLDGLWESSRKDAQERSPRSPTPRLWKSFDRAKSQYAEDLSRETVLEFSVERG